MRKTIKDDVVERARNQKQWAMEAISAYMGPTGRKTDQRTIDAHLSKMRPEQMAQLAQVNPVAAEQVDRRLQVIEARSTASPYSDIQE